MPNRNYLKGRRAEYKTIETLKNEGYICLRTAGSHGHYDVVAWDDYDVYFIQVKIDCLPSSKEIEKITNSPFPKVRNCHREIWVWTTRVKEPEVYVVE